MSTSPLSLSFSVAGTTPDGVESALTAAFAVFMALGGVLALMAINNWNRKNTVPTDPVTFSVAAGGVAVLVLVRLSPWSPDAPSMGGSGWSSRWPNPLHYDVLDHRILADQPEGVRNCTRTGRWILPAVLDSRAGLRRITGMSGCAWMWTWIRGCVCVCGSARGSCRLLTHSPSS